MCRCFALPLRNPCNDVDFGSTLPQGRKSQSTSLLVNGKAGFLRRDGKLKVVGGTAVLMIGEVMKHLREPSSWSW